MDSLSAFRELSSRRRGQTFRTALLSEAGQITFSLGLIPFLGRVVTLDVRTALLAVIAHGQVSVTLKGGRNLASATIYFVTVTHFHIRGATTVASRDTPVCRGGQWGILALFLTCPRTIIADR